MLLILLPGLGVILAGLCDRFSIPLAFIGIETPAVGPTVIAALEYALIGGFALGFILGIAAALGWAKVYGEEGMDGSNDASGTGNHKP